MRFHKLGSVVEGAPNGKYGKGLVVGVRPDSAHYAEQLVHQSIKWGQITDNEIDASADGATCWAFGGLIANNRVRSRTNEGWHHSFGRILAENRPAFIDASYASLTVEHNLFYCNWQNGFHFAHGSVGEIRNNIFTRTRGDNIMTGGPSTVTMGGVGLDIGVASEPTEGGGSPCTEPGECVSDAELSAVAGDTIYTTVRKLVNNTFDACNGPGVLTNDETVKVWVFKGNILSRHNMDMDYEEYAIDYLSAAPATFGNPGQDPEPKGWNVYWNNNEKRNYGDPIYRGKEDKTDSLSLDDSHPHYVGIECPGPNYSYMLQSIHDARPCGYTAQDSTEHSQAADAGPPGMAYWDAAGGPGVWSERNDAGAYGGPDNWWGSGPVAPDSCLEYTTLVNQCGN